MDFYILSAVSKIVWEKKTKHNTHQLCIMDNQSDLRRVKIKCRKLNVENYISVAA